MGGGLSTRLQGQGEGTLPDDIANGPGQGLQAVVTGIAATTLTIGEIPANAKVPAHISFMVDAGEWFVSLGLDAGDAVTSANAQYRLDAVAGPIGVIIDNPRKGFVRGQNVAGGDILRAEGSWTV